MIGINLLLADHPDTFADLSRQRDSDPSPAVSDFFSRPTTSGNRPFLYAECIFPYPDYPIKMHDGHQFQWLIEGVVYNYTTHEIQAQLANCFTSGIADIQQLQLLAHSFSGEFLLMIRTDDFLFIINDMLGRLPVYTSSSHGLTYFGRSLHWLHQHTKLKLDKTAVFEYLWCSYPLHFKTLYRDVRWYQGGSVTGINLQTQAITTHAGVICNFDERHDFDLEANTKAITSLFLRASHQIVNQADSGRIIVSLSGGLDSRAVAYGLNQFDTKTGSSSFLYPGAEEDVVVAEKVAAMIGMPWKKYTVHRTIENDEQLLYMKMGQNYIGLSFLLDYFKQLRRDHHRSFLLVTGDGGDKIFPYLGEANARLSFDQLVRKTAHRHSVIPIHLLSKLLDWTEDDFLHHLGGILNTYPESVPNNKSLHFILYEKVHQSFFEGEDRNRHFCWSTTPFYNLELFQYAMKIPDSQKRHYRLYRHFMDSLSPALARLPVDSGTHVHHPRFVAQKIFHESFRSTSPQIKSTLKKLAGQGNLVPTEEWTSRQVCVELIRMHPDLDAWIDTDQLKTLLRKATSDQYAYVLTLSQLAKVL